ncbi:MAG TPA: outer membrane protein assembly factor BamD [Candidatus Babeliales bacterium]|nr:outer membrane protein assembly factor BamD [Candidatus Babeliales bacterium]
MIKTRKHTILWIFSCIIVISLTGSLVATETAIISKFDVTLPQIEKKTHKQRMRKSTNKKIKTKNKYRTYQDMDYETLACAKDIQMAKGNTSVAIKYLEQMMKLATNITQLAEHLLEIADLFFVDGQFQKAAQLYAQYCELYPGSEKQEYALYQSIKSSFACTLSIDRDQTKTEETLALTRLFLQQDHFILYKSEVIQIQTQCYEKLAASDCNICNFYLTRGQFTIAEKRLKSIRLTWLPKLPDLEQAIFALEAELAKQKQQVTGIVIAQTDLDSNSTIKHMADRF